MNDLHPNNLLIYLPDLRVEESAWDTSLTKEELMKRMWDEERV